MRSGRAEFQCVLAADVYPYLGQYEVDGRSMLPAAAAIEFAVAGVASVLDSSQGFELLDVRVADRIAFDACSMELACSVDPWSFRIERHEHAGARAIAQGRFAVQTRAPAAAFERDCVGTQRERCCLERIALGEAYTSLLQRLVTSDQYARAELDREIAAGLAADGYAIHPVVWQVAIELARTLLGEADFASDGALQVGRIALPAAASAVVQIRACLAFDRVQVELIDAANRVVAVLADLRFVPPAAPAYALHWCEATAPKAAPDRSGRWLVIGDCATATRLSESLLRQGRACRRLAAERFGESPAPSEFDRVVYVAADPAPQAGSVAQPLSAALADVSRLAAASAARFWILTQGAHAPSGSEHVRPEQAALWSFGVALALELPRTWGGLIDLSAAASALELERAVREIESGDEDQVALRDAARFVPRLRPCPPQPAGTELAVRADASYLVTGGLGGLGLEVAARLAARGARSLVLLGRSRDRSALDRETAAKLRAIEEIGARVSVVQADVADPDAIADLAARFGNELPRLAGIIHTAGVVKLAAAVELSVDDLAWVCRPKIDGTLVLERFFAPSTLDFFVCFSSGASIWGSRGLAAYAAGSGFMDAWARSRAALGARTLSLNWGMWARVGMSADRERARLLSAIGLRAMQPSAALDALEHALSDRAVQRVIADIDWSIFRRLYEANAPRRKLLRELDAAPPEPAPAAMSAPASRGGETRARVRALLAELTGLSDGSIDADAPLNTLGIDSISALDLQARLDGEFGCRLEVTELVQGTTLDDIVERVAQRTTTAHDPLPAAHVLSPRPAGSPPCMSFPQERLWFLEQLDPGAATYNVPGVLRLRGELDLAQLQRAFQIVLARHEVLRTSFDSVDGAPAPVLHEHVELPFRFHDLSELTSDWATLARRELRRPFELARAPLVRLLVLRLAPLEHMIVLTMHHIVADAWSLGILVQELAAIQSALRRGMSVTLPSLPIQFSDYASWQRARVERGEFESGLRYWVGELEQAPRLLELPADRARPALRSARGALAPFVLPSELSQALRSCAQQHAVTPFAVCLAMYATLLHKYSRQLTVCVGVPVAGRRSPETRGLIGFFVNTIVLRTDFEAGLEVRDLLKRVMARAAQGLAHEDVPFERVVGALQPPRSASHTPLFQAGLAFQNVPHSGLNLPGLDAQLVELDPGVAKFDLHLTILERDGNFEGSLEYSTDLFEAATADRMLRHWAGLLEQATREPERTIDQLSLADSPERERVVQRWNRTALDFGPEVCLHRLFEAQAARTPERTAIVFRSMSLTYADLNRRANRLARRLRDAGIGRGDFVGVFIARSLELVVALLAILKSGAAYVPFDPSYPRARLEFLAQDAAPRLVLSHEPLRASAAFERSWLVDLAELAAGGGAEALPDVADGDSPAYMLYTSGSTGAPKGALNSHRAICNRLQWMQSEMKLDASDVVLQKTPIGFDVSVWELFWPLIVGARELLAEPGGQRDTGYLAQLIARQGVTTLHFVPSMLQTFLEQRGVEHLASLRRIVCSGEVLTRPLHDRSLRCWPRAALYNLYGPTEAAVDVSYWKCDSGDGRSHVPIGRPIANTQLYVLDAGMNPLPAGVPGELYIGGVQVGLGYHRRPELTSDRFVPDPFADRASGRLYKTGDLARWHDDGSLEYLGRIDQQIKLNGCRIEPGEIEAALCDQPTVAEAAVVLRSTAQGSQLVAYVVPAHERLSTDELRTALRAVLPEFMLPSFIVAVAALPRSPNGKLDRRALPAPERNLPAQAARAGDDVERALLGLWCELLDRTEIGMHESFFDAGGHSLLAARLAARMSQRFGTRISVAALLANPTLEPMARLVRGAPRVSETGVVDFGGAAAASCTFLVHPASGDASCYRGLASQLRSRTRVLGLRSPALTGGAFHDDVRSMAQEYVRALRRTQPKGPYRLGGWSFGGVVAFEMARQLLEAGEQVSALIVIDSLLPSPAAQAALSEPAQLRAFARDFTAMFGLSQAVVEMAEEPEAWIDALHELGVRTHGDALTRAEIALRMKVYCDNCTAMLAYRPTALPVRLALVLSEEGAEAEALFGSWANSADCVSRLVARGDHYSLLSGPNLASVTKSIQRLLEEQSDSSATAS